MENQLNFRSFLNSDSATLANIIYKTWALQNYTSEENAKRMAELYLRACLSMSTYACVAEQDGRPLGLIVVQDKRRRRLHVEKTLSLLKDGFGFLFNRDLLKLFKMQQVTAAANAKMYKMAGKKYNAELVFFVVDKNSRGLGVGKQLFQRALAYMKRHGIQNFYLYTDTLCNYGFYDAQGMHQNGRIENPNFPYRNTPVTFFLYDKILDGVDTT